MRRLIVIPLCLAAACSGGREEKAAEADGLQAGQWEVELAVSDFRATEKAAPALKAAPGDKSSAPGCVEAGQESKPPPGMFAGAGYECEYKDRYISGGRINLTMACDRAPLDGKVMVSVQGTYKGDSFEGTSTASSYLPDDGDFVIGSKISGRRTGPTCAARAAEAGKGKAKS